MPFEKSEIIELNQQIQSAEPLPEDFYELYKTIEDVRTTDRMIINSFLGQYETVCPCLNVSWRSMINGKNSSGKLIYMRYSHILSWKLEKQYSQEECFQFLMQDYDFLFSISGIQEASVFYFNKSYQELNIDQKLSIIVMIKNPSALNPRMHPNANRAAIEQAKKKLR